ncbi:MAG: (Myosin heavy-chain) kinase [Acidobacteria bacterium]|nr:(Myosin heavy-chain) kinase [Acidobacteriota bacterium]
MTAPRFCLLTAGVICLLSQSLPILAAQAPSAQSKHEPATLLTLGQSTERELAGDGLHEYQLKLAAGEFVQVRVEQKGIDVLITAYSAAGKMLATMDSPNGQGGLEILSWIAASAGTYRLEVRPLAGDAGLGKYRIALTVRHAAKAADRTLIEAERLFAEASTLRGSDRDASRAEALKKYEVALPKFREFQDDYRARLTEDIISAIKKNDAKARRKAKGEANGNVPQLVMATGHSNLVSSVAFSPAGKLLASASHDATIKLWDIGSGKELNTLVGHSGFVWSVAFSPDGRILASCSMDVFGAKADNSIKLWDVRTGTELKTLARHSAGFQAVAFNSTGTILASAGGSTVTLWNVERGEEVRTLTMPSSNFQSVVFSPNGKMLAGGGDKAIIIWDALTGVQLKSFAGHVGWVGSVAFNAKGTILASGNSDNTAKLWDVASGQGLGTLAHSDLVTSVAFSPDGKVVASASSDGIIKLWDVATRKELRSVAGHSSEIDALAFSADGTMLAGGGSDTTVKLWDPATGKELRTLAAHSASVDSVEFSPDRKVLASRNNDHTVRLWDIASGNVKALAGHSSFVFSAAFNPSGKIIATGSWDNTIKLWEVSTGTELRTLKGHSDHINTVAFSPDGKTLASGGWDRTIRLWDVETGKQIRVLADTRSAAGFFVVNSVKFSPDGNTLASGSQAGAVHLWDVTGLNPKPRLLGEHELVRSVAFGSDGKVLMSAGGWNSSTFKLWDLRTGNELTSPEDWAHWDGKFSDRVATFNGRDIRAEADGNKILLIDTTTEDELATLIAVDKNEWTVVDPDGRFDASRGAERLMYYVLNTPEVDYEVIDFNQLKLRYYEPGLLQKLFKGEPLRDVSAFRDVRLWPAVQELDSSSRNPASTKRTIKLLNRGGGIGRVQVFVNEREFIADARDQKLKQYPDVKEALVTFDLTGAPIIAGERPQVRVVAWNYDSQAKDEYKGYISSRGTELAFAPLAEKPAKRPELYAIIGGISDYAGDKLDLRFAAKDAEDIFKAINVGGKNLFGVERVHVTLLATGDNPRSRAPTKENFRKAFADYSQQAKPEDIFFVYLSGHGITLGHGSDTYLYLTKDANTTDVDQLKKDSDLLSRATLNSEELQDWFKSVRALKQVLILDTCAAGALVMNLSSQAKDIQTEAIRAIDQMQDVTGFHVLMGSAADAVSYEATQYGQGLLTYSLLQGIKSGEALEEGGRIDVSRLFQYAANKVPQLARNIGGIQRPEIRSPSGDSKSFAFGLISSVADKKEIPLETPKPLILRPVLQNQKLGYDNLKLTPLLRDALREESYATVRGRDAAPLVFVDAEEMPDAIIPSGNYTIEGDTIRVILNLIRNDEVFKSVTIEGRRTDLPGLVKKLVTQFTANAGAR